MSRLRHAPRPRAAARPRLAWIALAAVGLFAGPAPAQVPLFLDSNQNLGSAGSTSVALGDLDGDNDLDAFVANYSGPSAVWINQGGDQGGLEGVFTDSGQALGSGSAEDVALGDLDDDDDLDVFVVLDTFTGSNQVWINQGGAQGGTEGVFVFSGQSFGDDLSAAVALGDLDLDGYLDAFVTRGLGQPDKVWLNQGFRQEGTFADSGQALGSDGGIEVALGDLDGDSYLDAFVANGAANKVWINQAGPPEFQAGVLVDSGQSLGSALSLSVALGDLDGDNDLDAFVVNSGANKVWLNQGGAQGGAEGVFADSGQSLGTAAGRAVALGDLDGDNDLDAFVANNGPNAVWINQGGGAGTFADSGLSLGNALSDGTALGDLDGDSDLDAFVANNASAPNKIWRNTTIDPLTEVNPFGWQVQVVDTRGISGRGASLALDSSGHPHVSFIRHAPQSDGLDYQIIYARWDGVRWRKSLVDEIASIGVDMGANTSLALDAGTNPHIAYSLVNADGDGELRYALWDGGQWQTQTILGDPSAFSIQVSLVLDSGGNPHVGYHRSDAGYAFWDGTAWQTELVDSVSASFVGPPALALDASDRPHLAYPRSSAVSYARREPGGWQIETVDQDGRGFVDLVLDAAGVPHLSHRVGNNEVRYARRDTTGWETDTIFRGGNFSVDAETSLALDASGRPRISYSVKDRDTGQRSLYLASHNGVAWRRERVDDDGDAGLFNSLALDADGDVHIAYFDASYGDLRYVSWDRRWQRQSIDSVGTSAVPTAAIRAETLPVVGYHDLTAGLVNGVQWRNDAWMTDSMAFVSNPIGELSLAFSTINPGLYASFHDADAQRLMFAAWTGSSWNVSEIDSAGNVGRHNRLLFVREGTSRARVAYWDTTNGRAKLARFNAAAPTSAALSVNTAGPSLDDPGSGALAATVLPGGDIGISYYNGLSRDLHLGTWRAFSNTWSDELIASVGDIGPFHDLAADGSSGRPVVAYHDESAQAIRYAYRHGNGVWQRETAVGDVAAVSAVSLALGLNSSQHARIAYVDAGDDHLRLAIRRGGGWLLETVATAAAPADLAMALGHRPHLAVTTGADGFSHIFRRATLDVGSGTPLPPFGTYNPLDPCLAVFAFGELPGSKSRSAPAIPAGAPPAPGSLSDEEIYQSMGAHFAQTSAGRHYVDLYQQHGAEMGQLGLADPRLMVDAFGTLQNFLPGLEALVTGRGDEALVDQRMVDDALDIWQRLAAAGSPALQQMINRELAKYDNLQDFVGLSFEEWFLSLVDDDRLFADGFEGPAP